jgi:hypothetical protein
MLAVAFTMCAATPADHVQLECMSGGVALLEPGGWRTMTTTAQLLTTAPDSFALTLLGWSDASTLVIGSVSTGVTRLGLDGTLTHVGGGGGGNGGELLVLSPDGVTTALNTVEIDYVNNETHPEIVLTPVAGGPLRIIGKSAPAGDFGQPRWSPEGTSIAAVWTTASGVSLVASGIAIVDVATGTSHQIAVPVAWMGTDSPTPVAWLPPVR